MFPIVFVGIGGFLGAVGRYLVGRGLAGFTAFPYGVLTVNVVGSFLMGLVFFSPWFAKSDANFKNFFTVGFLGAFTTMSTLALDSFNFLNGQEFAKFALNIALNVILCLFAVFLGKIVW